MTNPDGGLAAMAAKDYYYEHYATEEERKAMDRHDNLIAAFGILLMSAVVADAIFEIVSWIS